MSDLTLRNVKGTPLTNQEVDDNFANLNADKYQAGDSPTFGDITADSINITGGSSAADISAASIQITGGTDTQGTLTWNTEDETIDLVVSDDVTYQLGQELGFVAKNLSGVDLANGRVVRATGASGNKLTIDLADATTEPASAPTVGVVTETISNNSTGRVTTAGFVRGLDTTGFTEGVPIYLGTNGTFTATKPDSPSHLVHLGWVIRSHATEGSILVHVNNGWEIDELHDVLITSVADNEILQWNADSSVWENRTLAEANIAELGTSVSFQDVTVTGDLTVSGTLTTINAEDLSIADNMIYLNDGSTNTNPDLGFAGNYNDGTYAHTGLFRDADDGRWKFYDSYTPEPDASIYIDTSHASFTYADIQVNTVYASGGNSSNWNTAYGWGNHASAGYQPANTALTTSTNFGGDVTGVYNNLTITGYNNTNWDTAYGWGNHASANYIVGGGTWTGGTGSSYTTLAQSVFATGNTKFTFYGNSGKMDVITDGEFYADEGAQRVFHDAYHPNADKWTTARTNTVSLTGDVTGSGSASVDGTGNWTVSISTAVANDSHSHSNYLPLSGGTMTGTIYFNDTDTRIQEGASNSLRIQTGTGYGDLGSMNTSWFHMQTDRPGFYTNKKLHVDGDIFVYGTQSQLTSSSVRAPIFYDSNNTSYYVDPASTSNINILNVADINRDPTVTVNLTGDVTGSGSATMTNLGNATINIATSAHSDGFGDLFTFTESITLTTDWQDTSISGTDLPTGSYVVQVLAYDSDAGGGQYNEHYTGYMSWFESGTNDTAAQEIPLHNAGHADNDRAIFLRTKRNSNPGVLVLQIAGRTNNTAADDYVIKFRRMI